MLQKVTIKKPNPLYILVEACELDIKKTKKMQRLYKMLRTHIPNGNIGI